MVAKNWKRVGYLIPENIEPEENICICVPVPKDWGHINAFMGQMTELAKWLTWEKTGDDSALRAARRWIEIIGCITEEVNCKMSSNCGCGGENPPVEQRIDDNGFITVSPDGGATWVVDTANDGRFVGTTLPPAATGTTDEKKCQYANSIVTTLKEKQAADLALRETASSVTDFINGITGFLIGLGVITGGITVVITVLAGVIFSIVTKVVAADFAAAFTEEVWADTLCAAYCSMADDGSFSQAQFVLFQGQIREKVGLSGTASDWLVSHIKVMGTVGLTNAARQLRAGALDCSGCECIPPCEDPARFTVGTLVDQGIDIDGNLWYELESGINPDGGGDVVIWGQMGEESSVCCTWYSTEITEGDCPGSLGRFITPTGTTDQLPFESAAPAENISAFAVLQNGCPFGNPFTVRLTLSACTEE